MVTIGIGGDGHQPNAFDAQVFEVVELLGQALEVSHAVAITVLIGTYKHLHKGTALPVGRQRAGLHRSCDWAGIYGKTGDATAQTD